MGITRRHDGILSALELLLREHKCGRTPLASDWTKAESAVVAAHAADAAPISLAEGAHTAAPWEFDGIRITGPALEREQERGRARKVDSTVVATVVSDEYGSYANYPPLIARANAAVICAAPIMHALLSEIAESPAFDALSGEQRMRIMATLEKTRG